MHRKRHASMSSSLGIALPLRRGISEGRHRLGSKLGLQQPRENRYVDAEAACIAELRYQADIGERRQRAEAERPWLVLDQGFAGTKAFAIGPGRPGHDFLLRMAELAQPVQHLQVLHRVG